MDQLFYGVKKHFSIKGAIIILSPLVVIIIILSLILLTQFIALFIQYIVNKNHPGIIFWLLGSILMAIGFIFMILVSTSYIKKIAIIANPLVILGLLFLYIGVTKFLSNETKKWVPISIFITFNLLYYYFMYVEDSISNRTYVITLAIAIISFMISYQLFFKKDKGISISANFTALVFSLHGSYNLLRFFQENKISFVSSYSEQTATLLGAFAGTILMSNLWTFGFIVMLNQRMNSNNEKEKEKLHLIFNTNLDPQLITRLEDGYIVDVNEVFLTFTGYSKKEVVGNYAEKINLWENLEDRNLFKLELREKGLIKNKEFIFQRKDKSQFYGMISAKIIMIDSESYIISVIRDITERKEFIDALIESEEKYRSILDASPDDITITDLDGNILMVSPAAQEIFGFDLKVDRFIGTKLTDYIIPEDADRAKANIKKMYDGKNLNGNEYTGVRKDKSTFDIEVNSRFIYDSDGNPNRMVFVIRDISERKKADLQIQGLLKQLEIEKDMAQLYSITDSLTGLLNRGYFDEALAKEFARLNRSGSKLSLIMLDIDFFKKFNDTYGHPAGDECLKTISRELKKIVERESDFVARYGGEEFIVILPETDEKGAKLLAERLRKAVEDLAIPHSTSSISQYVTVSLGVATVYPKELVSQEQALKIVDEALYSAKNSGRNRCVFNTIGKI